MMVAALLSVVTRVTPYVRDRAADALTDRFRSDVELDSLQVSIFPRPAISGEDVTLRHRGRTDVPALLHLEKYSATAGVLGLLRSPLRIRTLALEGLTLRIPPRAVDRPRKAADPETPPQPRRQPARGDSRIIIDHLSARAARLEIVPRDRARQNRVFEIHGLEMRNLGDGGGAPFRAALRNPAPRGEAILRGTFGPWDGDEPGLTPVRGDYQLFGGNLDAIKGLAGTMSSAGHFSGALERIEVRGQTETPDFSIDVAGQRTALNTRFHGIVDGTTGDTWLENIEARLGDTLVRVRGAVVRPQEAAGRRTSLHLEIDEGRAEDILKLAVKSPTAPLTGKIRLAADLILPAGDLRIVDRLMLDGSFSLNEARFANVNVQERIDTLSRRGMGKATGEGPSVVSRVSSRFALRKGRLTFTDLSFRVAGAEVQLAGTYDLRREWLDFRGNLLLDAPLAKTTTGFKSLLARLAQPLFRRRGGGSKVPIRISGRRAQPEFKVDIGRALGPG